MLILLTLLACTDDKPDDKPDDSGTETPTDTGEDGGTETTSVPTQEGCEDRHQSFLTALQADFAGTNALGVSAALMEDGVITCRVALGRRLVDEEGSPDIETLFQIGSTTKMFTSLALLQRVEDGGLSIDTSLAEALPGSDFALDADWNDAITMQHLMTHQGGFYDYLDWAAVEEDEDLAAFHQEVFFPNLWLMSPPGAFWNYSNPNFNLAGLVVEEADGRWYPDLMVEEVFGPLGMPRTVMRKAQAEADGNFAEGWGYSIILGEFQLGDVPIRRVVEPASARPAGASTWTTPTQMLEMARFLMEGDSAVLRDDLRLAMTEPQVSLQMGPTLSSYGYGIIVVDGFSILDDYYELPLWDHGGNTLSYSSDFYILPDQGFAISILSSGYGVSMSNAIVTALQDLAELPAPVAGPEWTVDPERLDRHVGVYEDAYNVGEFIITRQDDTLHIQIPLLESLGYTVQEELEPLDSDLWLLYLDGVAYDLSFIGDEAEDSSTWVRNRTFVGTRTSSGFAPQTELAPPLAAGRLADRLWQGRYRPTPINRGLARPVLP